MNKTPIALFVYNRPNYAAQVIDSISSCDRFNECQLFIFCDGPKKTVQEQAVTATRKVVHQKSSTVNAKVIERDQNLGLSKSITTGVSMLCEKYGKTIVIEDDHQFSPSFLDYMLQALEHYQDNDEVVQISGYMFPIPHPAEPKVFLLPLTTTRGWATWNRAWQLYSNPINKIPSELSDPDIQNKFDLGGIYPFSQMLFDKIAGSNDSWAISFWWQVFIANKLVLHPQHSLVWVGGWDGSGVHSGLRPDHDQLPLHQILNYHFPSKVSFPDNNSTFEPAFESIKDYLVKQKTTEKTTLIKKIRNKVNTKFRK